MKKNRLLWALLLMVAPLLYTSCSSEEETRESQTAEEQETAEAATTGTAIHYEAVVSDGNSTRASVDGDKKYIFQKGDKLYVTGTGLSGVLTLKSGAGASTATFEGDLVYDSEDDPADDLELTAVLVGSADKLHTVVDGQITATAYPTTAITSTLAEAVEKYSQFTATSAYGSKSFTLYQQSTFLNFVITLEDGTAGAINLNITIENGGETIRTGSVKTITVSGKTVAQFVAAVPKETKMSDATVQLGKKDAIPFGGTATLAANKIYNIKKTVDPEPLAAATTAHIGWVISSKGHIYEKASIVNDGGTALAMIAYITSTGHGLAAALEDVSDWIHFPEVDDAFSSWASSRTVSYSGATWRVPSMDDWKYMFEGCGGTAYTPTLSVYMRLNIGDFQDNLEACGGKKCKLQYGYWSNTRYDSEHIWVCHILGSTAAPESGSDNGQWFYPRAVLAF